VVAPTRSKRPSSLGLNLRPSGYEPDELPGCSTPRSCRSYATKSDGYPRRIAVSQSSARQSFTATSPISPVSPPTRLSADIKTQTAQVLRRVDELLNLAGTDKSQLLSAQVWIADMRLFEDHNSVWNEWVDPANPPARACLTTDFWRPGMLVEVMVVAAVP
jgi:enamine deaminase RidA (YjgF/YER057c/UK114 family)